MGKNAMGKMWDGRRRKKELGDTSRVAVETDVYEQSSEKVTI